jgi:Eukaryotic aspartyl protease
VIISAGTSKDEFELQINTATQDFWIAGNSCSDDGCVARNHLNITDVAYSDTGRTWLSNYWISLTERATASGDIVVDSMTIAGLSIQEITFGAASDVEFLVTQDVLHWILDGNID